MIPSDCTRVFSCARRAAGIWQDPCAPRPTGRKKFSCAPLAPSAIIPPLACAAPEKLPARNPAITSPSPRHHLALRPAIALHSLQAGARSHSTTAPQGSTAQDHSTIYAAHVLPCLCSRPQHSTYSTTTAPERHHGPQHSIPPWTTTAQRGYGDRC